MLISEHKTRSVLERYNTLNENDISNTFDKLAELLKNMVDRIDEDGTGTISMMDY